MISAAEYRSAFFLNGVCMVLRSYLEARPLPLNANDLLSEAKSMVRQAQAGLLLIRENKVSPDYTPESMPATYELTKTFLALKQDPSESMARMTGSLDALLHDEEPSRNDLAFTYDVFRDVSKRMTNAVIQST